VVQRVAGPAVEVALVLPAGQMDHGYEPRPQEVARLAGVELAFGVGLGLDPWLPRVLAAATDGRARVVDLGPAMDPRPVPAHVLELVEGGPPDPDHDLGEGALDPHVFLDPRRMAKGAIAAADALAAWDPAGAPGYEVRGQQVAERLFALDAEIRARLAPLPRRTLVTFHGSFFYFAEAYGLRVAAVVELLPGREPSPRYLARVVETVRRSGAAAVFTEPQLDPAPARVLAAEAGLPLHELDPVGGGPEAATYEALLLRNVAALEAALR
jgi:ABC-type Zn uptake system ZnuABC Zn-binding protein ZnuA